MKNEKLKVLHLR